MNFAEWANTDLADLALGNKIEQPAVYIVGPDFNCSISTL